MLHTYNIYAVIYIKKKNYKHIIHITEPHTFVQNHISLNLPFYKLTNVCILTSLSRMSDPQLKLEGGLPH